MSSAPASPAPESARARLGARRALAGFLIPGFLLALLGAVLPAWGYHRDPPEFVVVGNCFLTFGLGIAVSVWGARILARRSPAFLLVLACVLSCAALVFLALAPPPYSAWWRAGGLLALGAGAGMLGLGLFHAISGDCRLDPAGAVNKGGIWFGLGCLTATLLVALTFYASSIRTILLLLAAAPAIFAIVYARTPYAPAPETGGRPLRQAFAEFRSPGAVMFALLLFIQFGNEWSIAGWMPIFLIRRVGLSPTAALFNLAMYWLFLMAGRIAAVAILPRVRHTRLLALSVFSATFGCLILYSTKTGFGAASAAFFLGAGFSTIYPLVAEAIGSRFPYYHPGLCSSIFSLAVLGGLLAPATLGYAAAKWGVGVVIGIPLVGTFLVMALVLLIRLETKVTGR